MVPKTNNGHPVFDDEYPWEQNYECPWSKPRMAEFQKQIDRIAGLASNGKPNVRLIWPSDPAIAFHVVNGELRARYRLWTDTYRCTRRDEKTGLDLVEDIQVDIVPPRFGLEQYHEPAEESFNPSSHGLTGSGYYTPLCFVAHHSEKCCDGRGAVGGRLCLGLYHEPNYVTLEDLQRRIKERDEARHGHRPGERVTEDEFAEDRAELREWQAKYDTHLQSSYYEAAKNAMSLHGWRMFNHDAGKKSRYHILGGTS